MKQDHLYEQYLAGDISLTEADNSIQEAPITEEEEYYGLSARANQAMRRFVAGEKVPIKNGGKITIEQLKDFLKSLKAGVEVLDKWTEKQVKAYLSAHEDLKEETEILDEGKI